MTRLLLIGGLVAAWCALWGEVSAANVASGVALSLIVMVLQLGSDARAGVRLRPLLKFVAIVIVDLITSTALVMWEVLTPTDRTAESIVAVPVPMQARSHLLLLIVAVTVTPGTAVVDAEPDTGTLYLHLLHDRRRDETVAQVQRLARLACEALPIVPIKTEEITS